MQFKRKHCTHAVYDTIGRVICYCLFSIEIISIKFPIHREFARRLKDHFSKYAVKCASRINLVSGHYVSLYYNNFANTILKSKIRHFTESLEVTFFDSLPHSVLVRQNMPKLLRFSHTFTRRLYF